MHIEIVDTLDAFRKLEPVWNDVLSRSDTDIPFLSYEWLSPWWTVCGEGGMLILLVKDGSETVAIAPLRRVLRWWRGLPVRAIALPAEDYVFRCGFIVGRDDPSVVELILRYLRETGHAFELMAFDRLVSGSLTHSAIIGYVKRMGMPYAEMKSNQSPYVAIRGTWEEYYGSLSRNLRSKMKLAHNQFKRYGGCEIVRFDGGNLNELLEDLFAISRRTWKFRAGTAIASNPARIRFYRLASEAIAARGWLNLRILRVAGKPVAFNYNIDYKGTSFFVKTGFDEDYRHLASTGEFLNYSALKESFEAGLREYDLMGKDEPYKMRLTSLCRDHRKIYVFSGSLYGRLLSKVQSEMVPFLKAITRRLRARTSAQHIE